MPFFHATVRADSIRHFFSLEVCNPSFFAQTNCQQPKVAGRREIDAISTNMA
jgi:hypothetical protein